MTEVEHLRLRPRCVYAGGRRAEGVLVLVLPCEPARYVVADLRRGEFHAVAFKEDALELLRSVLGVEAVEVRPCGEAP